MRILFMSPHSDPQAKLGEPDAGGQCVYEHELAMQLAHAGHEVLTFCRQRNHHPPVTRVMPGYTIYRITAGGDGFIPKEKIAETMPEFTRKVSSILGTMRKKVPTVIHGHYWDGAMASLLLKRNFQDYPFVWTPHSLGYSKRDKYKGILYEAWHHFIPRLMWENYGTTVANRIICSTRDEKRKLLRYYNVLNKRVEIVPPGMSIGTTDKAEKYRKKWNIPADTKILLCLGRMARTKGYQHAIRIVSKLQNKTNEKFVLVVVGGGSHITSEEEKMYQKELRKLVAKLGVSDKVIFHPSVPHGDVQSIYSLADYYLMTAEEEPFGLTVIEAMAAGCVVISHNRGGAKQIIGKDNQGLIVDMHKYDSVAEEIAGLLYNPKKAERMGKRASRAAIEKYSWNNRVHDFIKVYEDIAYPAKSRIFKIVQSDSFFRSITKIEEPKIIPEDVTSQGKWPTQQFFTTSIYRV